jgi:hypothetical protein
MGIKNKLIGFILIVLGVWPFLLKIESVETYFATYKFLEVLTPGEIVYQLVIILLGVWLIWKVKARVETAR